VAPYDEFLNLCLGSFRFNINTAIGHIPDKSFDIKLIGGFSRRIPEPYTLNESLNEYFLMHHIFG